MTTRIKLPLQITIIFFMTSLPFLLVHSHNRSDGFLSRLPPPLLSGILLILLYSLTVLIVVATTNKLCATISTFRKKLAEANATLEETTRNLEERVERRTFEIAVANASLHREIAERIQAENATERIKRRMELILDSAGEGIFGLDAEGRVSFVNKAASSMLGWPPEELTGRLHHELVHHSHTDGTPYPVEDCPIHQAYRDGKVYHRTGEMFWTKSGQGFGVEYVSTPIVENKHLAGAVVIFRDLCTYRKNSIPQPGAGNE